LRRISPGLREMPSALVGDGGFHGPTLREDATEGLERRVLHEAAEMESLVPIDGFSPGALAAALAAPGRAFGAGNGAPATVVSLPSRVHVAARQSAQVDAGGDFFEVFQHADGRVSIVVADVCGSGPLVAPIAAEIRPALHAALARGDSPGRVLAALNDDLTGLGAPDRFVTAVAVRLDARLCVAEVACAGHLGPFVRRADGFAEATSDATGVPLGLLSGESYVETMLDLAAGDTLVLVTDGITDPLSADDDPLGAEAFTRRLEALALDGGGSAQDAAGLCHALLDGGEPPRDDATVLVLQLPARELVPAAA
jgi:serine phosphatase RsbU (regulator of sigma subunit)